MPQVGIEPDNDVAVFIELLLAGTSPQLIETEVRPEIFDRVRGLPVNLCRGPMGFEFHLAEELGTCGIGFGLYNEGTDLDSLHLIPCENYGAHAADGRAALAFLKKLRKDVPQVWRAIKAAWLEFDIGTDGFPGLFFSMPGYRAHRADQPDGPGAMEICSHLIEGLPGPGRNSPVADRLANLISETADIATLNHVGWMIGRGVDRLKVDLRVDGPERVMKLIERTGLAAIRQDISSILAEFRSVDDPIMVQLEVGPEVAPKIGLQFYCFDSAVRLASILDTLTDMNLACAHKAEALARFARPRTVPASSWPQAVWKRYRPSGHEVLLIEHRTVCHFKLTLRPDRPVSAKCYVNGDYLWYDRTNASSCRI